MGDLISREEAIKAVKFYETFCDPYPRVIEALEDLPSVQPRKGKWITDNPHSDMYRYTCSECKAQHRARYDLARYNFCPNCGADMREGDSDDD